MSLALYRTYRPGRFADVVGQEHVTATLSRALESGRLHHAYLFSGPRGCGKTSSARILARSLNCAAGPTSQPCGTCQSCLDLAPNGPGSIDVIEIDAATHGLVDDARDLRERAHFSPASSRYKVYIIDEAHQLGPGAANALLKIIEEPPAHLLFVFATTAPDKLLGTIRSRTHHYPFRLVAARTLVTHLADICRREDVLVESSALSLVARAGAGSVRDALSVLGQLIAGAGPEGVTTTLANSLLGFTDATLLDEVVDALGVRDAATLFAAVDRVMGSGHDPRRFLTDLLERLRDLLLLQYVPDAVARGLVEVAQDEGAALTAQANRFGPSDLLRLSGVIDEGITAMKGTTPTRLQLELVCARLLLPGVDDSVLGVQARLDVIERRLASGGPAAAAARPGPRPPPGAAAARPPEPTAVTRASEAAPAISPATQPDSPVAPAQASPGTIPTSRPPTPAAAGTEPAPSTVGELTVGDVRRMWPTVLDRLRELRKAPWSFISQSAGVLSLDAGVLTLSCASAGLRDQLNQREDYSTYLRQALQDVLAVDWQIVAVVDPSAAATAGPGVRPSALREDPWLPPQPGAAAAGTAAGTEPSGRSSRPRGPGRTRPGGAGSGAVVKGEPQSSSTPRSGALQEPSGRAQDVGAAMPNVVSDGDSDPDDPELTIESHRALLARELGATVIDEIQHD